MVHVLPLLMIAYFVYRAITPWQIRGDGSGFYGNLRASYAVDFKQAMLVISHIAGEGADQHGLQRDLYLLIPLAMFMTFDASEEGEFEKTGQASSRADGLSVHAAELVVGC